MRLEACCQAKALWFQQQAAEHAIGQLVQARLNGRNGPAKLTPPQCYE
jgi:hypothetical protein